MTGLLLEQDARLPRIALAMAPTTSMASRQRRLARLLDGPMDVRRCYRQLLQRVLKHWYVDRVFLLLDTTSIGGRIYFVRLAIAHAGRAIPLAWRAYEGRSATVSFAAYREVLEEGEALLPRRLSRVLLADRGFQHLRLMEWCHDVGWLYRLRAKSGLGIGLSDGTTQRVGGFRKKRGTLRILDTVFLGGRRVGPAGLVLCWPRYGENSTLHVLSPDAPSERTLWEFTRLAAIERAFRDDKSGCFGIERSRLTTTHRVDRLLLGIAIAQLLLVSLATRLEYGRGRRHVDANAAGGLSLLQLGARALRSDVWNGVTPQLGLCLVPDDDPRGAKDERRVLRAFYHRLGLEPGKRWIPAGSFEERNAMWWLQGQIKRYPPRMPLDDPPLLWRS